MIQSRTRHPTEPQSPVDQPGAIRYDNPQAEQTDEPRAAPSPREIPQSLQQPDRPATRGASDSSASDAAGSSGPATASANGTYQTLGGVVARVNSTPIYAEQILSAAEPRLASLATELDERTFRLAARKEIAEEISRAILAELRFAAAERYLSPEDRQYAKDLTAAWRARQINATGGSIETARDAARRQGKTFDELVQQQHRNHVRMLYDRRKIYPRVRVTAADMRRYYEQNRSTRFTVPDEAQFELIQINPKIAGSAEAARAKAKDLRDRAASGEDFTKLAEFSHGPRMRASDGSLNWIQRGAFAMETIEDAVWKLQPGEVTPVIEHDGSFYIARLEQKKLGRMMPFDDETVQQEIRNELEQQQLQRLREELTSELLTGAVIRGHPRDDTTMMQPAVDLAMQRYARWAQAK
jgi:parvulin-like peptidyl-prolyl isomerase